MNEENKQQAFELISKYLAGEASPEEAMHLHQSLKNKEIKNEYDKIIKLWNQLPGEVPGCNAPPAQSEWTELNEKLEQQKRNVRKIKFSRLAIAASIMGLILIVSYSLLVGNNEEQGGQVSIEQQIIRAATTEPRTDTLPDGSVIIVNTNSSVSYSPSFNTADRQLELTGESYFNVVPNKAKPFIISIDDLRIKVVGTSFNVRSSAANDNVEVQVQSGVVKMYTPEKEITVIKGQTGIYSKTKGDLILKDTIDVNSVSYATKSFSFNDISFVDASRYLEKAFNVVIRIDTEKFAHCSLTAEFNNKPLDYILDIISATLNSNYNKQGNIIYITGQGCR